MIQAVVRVVAPPDKRDEFFEVVRSLTGPTQVAKGCHDCRAFRDMEDDNVITYWVQWDSLDELGEHFRCERFRQLLPYIEMSTEPPQLEVSRLEPLGGIEVMLAAMNARVN